MMAVNIILLVVNLPLLIAAAAVNGKGPRGHAARAVSGVAAVYGLLLVAECGIEWLIGFADQFADGTAYAGVSVLRWLPFGALALSCVLAVLSIVLRRRPATVFFIGCGAAVLTCAVIILYFYNLPPAYADYFSWAAVIPSVYAVYAAFWLADTLMKPEGKVQTVILNVMQVVFAVAIVAMLTYSYTSFIGPMISADGYDVLGIITLILIAAAIAWPALVSGGTVLASMLRSTQGASHDKPER